MGCLYARFNDKRLQDGGEGKCKEEKEEDDGVMGEN